MTSHPTPSPTPEYLANTVPNETPRLLRLIDRPFLPPSEVRQRSRAFIASVGWTFSTTMPQFPHEYVVRARVPRALRDAYDQLWRDTLAHGFRGRFGSVVHWYLIVESWRYWSCTTVDCVATARPCPNARFGVGCVINRALNDDLADTRLDPRLQIPGLEDGR